MKKNGRWGCPGSASKRKTILTVALCTLVLVLLSATQRAEASVFAPWVPLDVNAGSPLESVLLDLAGKAHMLLSAGSLAGYEAPAIKGTYAVRQALELLLANSGLSYEIDGDTIFIFPSKHPDLREAGANNSSDKLPRRRSTSETAGEGDHELHQVTVEGHIQGSPLNTSKYRLTRDDLERGGFENVGDALKAVPQSFGGGLNVGVISAGGSQNTASQSAAATANLRGLGSDSTLVLINGQRVASSEGSGAVDVTLIPIAAVDHIEIDTGSAAALYGSDAVAGVVNIILRTDFQGLELNSAWGGATEGGYFLQHYSVVAGHAGHNANAFAAGDCARQQEIDSQERGYLPSVIAGTTLLPGTKRCSGLFSVGSIFPYDIETHVVGAYTGRSAYQAQNLALSSNAPIAASSQSDVVQYAINAAVTLNFLDTWRFELSGGRSADNVDSPERLTRAGVLYQRGGDRFDNRLWTGQAILSGTVIDLPSGPWQLALGAGYNQQDFDFADLPDGGFSISQRRRIRFAFAESAIPLIAPATGSKDPILTLDIAVRTERYSDVGRSKNPKAAIAYKPNSTFKASVSFGTSFRAPSLLQQFDIPTANLEFVPDIPPGTGRTLALVRFGGNPLLRPETSTDYGLDLTFTPNSMPGASFQLGYYDIFYRHRIEYPTPNTTDPLSDKNVWPFVTATPSPAYISEILAHSQFMDFTSGQYTPQGAAVVVDDRNQNIAHQKASGVDLLANYIRDSRFGRWDTSLNVANLTLQQQITSATSTSRLSGSVFYPPSWRGRFGVSWSYTRYLASLFANYTGGSWEVTASGPEKRIASWTTLDSQVGVIFNGGSHWGRTKLTLSLQNMLNRHPPLISISQPGPAGINYDSTNTSPVGLFVALQLTQSW